MERRKDREEDLPVERLSSILGVHTLSQTKWLHATTMLLGHNPWVSCVVWLPWRSPSDEG